MAKLYFLFGYFGMGMIGCGLFVYVRLMHMQVILDTLKESIIVDLFFDDFGSSKGLFSRVLFGALIFPGRHLREGTLRLEELKAIPGSIMFQLKLAFWLLASSILCLFGQCIYLSVI